jgi:hypothetical protein
VLHAVWGGDYAHTVNFTSCHCFLLLKRLCDGINVAPEPLDAGKEETDTARILMISPFTNTNVAKTEKETGIESAEQICSEVTK